MATKATCRNTNVVVVDDDADARLCLQDILQEAGDFNCTGSFSNAADALVDIPRLHPDLVLMDIHLPGLNGIECTKRLKRIMPRIKIVMVTGLHDANLIERSLSAGAVAYLIKPVIPDQCLATLKCAVAGEAGLKQKSQEFEQSLPPVASLETCPLLTKRDNEIMRCLAEGLLYKEIADKLKISYSAVHKHQHKIFAKLHAANRTEAISRWRGENWTP